ncbi:MAG: GNAT family N-acetyltransferase [Promethearchaeota archaeon]
MDFTISQAKNDEDWNFFFDLSFRTLKALRKSFYEQLVSANPGKSESELYAASRKELEEYCDFQDPNTRVFIAANDDGLYCGYLWMGERNSEDYWDFQKPQWIYDIVVEPNFRGNGLGKKLMSKAEEFAKEMKRDIGLFVHEDNTAAINLYKKENYFIKCIPMSKKIEGPVTPLQVDSYIIRKSEDRDVSAVRGLGLVSYQEMVKISKDVPEEQAKAKYEEYWEKISNLGKDLCTFVAETSNGDVVGFLTVGVADFSDEIGRVYDSAFDEQHRNQNLMETLVSEAELWSSSKSLSRLYYLLNSSDDISQDILQYLGFGIPGYFMEKDLFRDVLT